MDKIERGKLLRERLRKVNPFAIRPPLVPMPKKVQPRGNFSAYVGFIGKRQFMEWVRTPDSTKDENVPEWRRVKRNSPLTEIAEKLKPGADALEEWWK